MLRRRDDPYYIRSAAATLAFYVAVLAIISTAAYFLGWYALGGLAALLLGLYRGPLFGAARWPEPVDVDGLIRAEKDRVEKRAPLESTRP